MNRLLKLTSLSLLMSAACAAIAHADVLDWSGPTQRENGNPLDPATGIANYKLYKNGALAATIKAPATTYDTGSTYCDQVAWQITAVDKTLPPVGPLESKLSPSTASVFDSVGCIPKSPGGLTVRKQ